MNDQPYNSLPVGVSPAVLEVIQQEGKEWERRADRLEKDWEYEKRRADRLEEALKFYATESNYWEGRPSGLPYGDGVVPVEVDEGKIARAALAAPGTDNEGGGKDQ